MWKSANCSLDHESEYYNVINNALQDIDLNVVTLVQKELSKQDVTSLAYLLYGKDEIVVALERLTLLQELHYQNDNNLNLLVDWVKQARKIDETMWKFKFLEALSICQLYGVIKKLGFNVTLIKTYFQSDNLNFVYNINPVKKVLYKIADNMTNGDLKNLKELLKRDSIQQYKYGELIFLKLEIDKLIIIDKDNTKLNELISIFKKYFKELYHTYLKEYDKISAEKDKLISSTPASGTTDPSTLFDNEHQLLLKIYEHLKSDNNNPLIYQIKSKDRIGLCYIINQEKFHSSSPHLYTQLENREGSSKDKTRLFKLMTKLRFNVKIDENLKEKELLQNIVSTLQKDFCSNDSVFILFILSHGVKGHIYSADCVPVNINCIKKIIDSNIKLQGIPKVLIIQACQQVRGHNSNRLDLKADGPTNHSMQHYIKGADFLVCWATAPGYEAFRYCNDGSIFIKILCLVLNELAEKDHLIDIFTIVTNIVTHIFSTCTDKDQLPTFESTFLKNLYLKVPS